MRFGIITVCASASLALSVSGIAAHDDPEAENYYKDLGRAKSAEDYIDKTKGNGTPPKSSWSAWKPKVPGEPIDWSRDTLRPKKPSDNSADNISGKGKMNSKSKNRPIIEENIVTPKARAGKVHGPGAPLNVFQIYRSPPEKFMEHNKHFLPPNAVFRFFSDHAGMEESMKTISVELQKAGVVDNAYEAFSYVRPISWKTDIWRAAALWMYGGMYFDHKVVLSHPVANYIDLTAENHIYLPLDSTQVTNEGHYAKHGFGGRIGVQTALMYSTARHPALASILRHQISNVNRRYYGSMACETTGPIAFFNGLHAYELSSSSHNMPKAVRDTQWIRLNRYTATANIRGGTIHSITYDAKYVRHGVDIAYFDFAAHRAGKGLSMPYKQAWAKKMCFCSENHPHCGEPLLMDFSSQVSRLVFGSTEKDHIDNKPNANFDGVGDFDAREQAYYANFENRNSNSMNKNIDINDIVGKAGEGDSARSAAAGKFGFGAAAVFVVVAFWQQLIIF
eukprot:gene822-868_t